MKVSLSNIYLYVDAFDGDLPVTFLTAGATLNGGTVVRGTSASAKQNFT